MKNGFTLIEIIVAVAVFSLVVAVASGVFATGLKAQRSSLAYQELLDQTSYLMEYMSRAIRMARKDLNGSCTGTAKANYAFLGQCLMFKNYKGNCQQFCLDGERLKNKIIGLDEGYLTSDKLKISSFRVNMVDAPGWLQNDNFQPKVTIFLDIQRKGQKAEDTPRLKIQTTISQRNLDVKR